MIIHQIYWRSVCRESARHRQRKDETFTHTKEEELTLQKLLARRRRGLSGQK